MHTIGFQTIPNSNPNGFGAILDARGDERRRALVAEHLSKAALAPVSAPRSTVAPPVARNARSTGRSVSRAEVRAALAARGVSEARLHVLFGGHRSVERACRYDVETK